MNNNPPPPPSHQPTGGSSNPSQPIDPAAAAAAAGAPNSPVPGRNSHGFGAAPPGTTTSSPWAGGGGGPPGRPAHGFPAGLPPQQQPSSPPNAGVAGIRGARQQSPVVGPPGVVGPQGVVGGVGAPPPGQVPPGHAVLPPHAAATKQQQQQMVPSAAPGRTGADGRPAPMEVDSPLAAAAADQKPPAAALSPNRPPGAARLSPTVAAHAPAGLGVAAAGIAAGLSPAAAAAMSQVPSSPMAAAKMPPNMAAAAAAAAARGAPSNGSGAPVPPGATTSMPPGAAAAAGMHPAGGGPPRGVAAPAGPPSAAAAGKHPYYQPGDPHGPPPPATASGPKQPPPPAAAAAPPPPQQPTHLRELRVEDALLYLDDVKREFKDRPAIYNEFLSIMKNFKTQEVDTPGVINRVSRLFRGYNNLILGFNTFLPEGYKISLEDLKRQDALLAAEEQEAAAAAAAAEAERAERAALERKLQYHQQQKMRGGSAPQQQQQQQQQGHAWGAGAAAAERAQQSAKAPPPSSSYPPGAAARAPGAGGKQQRAPAQAPKQQQQQQQQQGPPPQAQQQQQQQQQQGPPQQQHQAVEFDHAISYVTKIKRRFASDPSIYHSFLEILHNYQREQRGIKEVLEQVAHLFQDHPDLLKEFTFFLPDAVQEQAKERLHRAAAESESRQAAAAAAARQQEAQEMEQQQQYAAQQQSSGRGAAAAPTASGSRQKFIDMTARAGQQGTALSEDDARATRKRLFDGQQAAGAPPPQHPPPAATAAAEQQPDTYIYNSAVERQFFDATKEALTSYTRDGGQAWAEFLKCLDMYAQDILSRAEMLNFVEPLLGKRHTKLFEEFKRILAAAGNPPPTAGAAAAAAATPLTEESWYSVPLAEIDFSRCRRCSPSYRALPRDYPAHPCSDRSPEEAAVLNDVWVSLPVGSEESYTFRHMRRNTYEETLFRVEDERFEIDMVIDSNAATLQRLLPIAEEIAILAQQDVIAPAVGDGKQPPSETAVGGLGGKRYQYTFDKKILGVIHRNTISRIYGDAGPEMLEWMVKNPTVAVPLVVDRLRQKDREWRAVRDRLNHQQWKDLAEQNYYKSLDHRGLTWRTIDKRATSTRTMIVEMKDRAANGGKEGAEALRLKLDKAKEEHGTFYEVTMGETLSKNLDLTFLPKPDRRIFTPHISLQYHNNSWVQRDAYRILAFALERGPISPADKERCHRLWVEFLGPWFHLAQNWMQAPAVTYQESTAAAAVPTDATEPATVVSEDDEDEESMDEDAVVEEVNGPVVTEDLRQQQTDEAAAGQDDKEFTDHHPLPPQAKVSTLYGEGKVLEFRKSDHIYVVQLAFGVGYLRPATVLCSMLPVETSAYTSQLRANDRTKLARPSDQLAFGTQSLYLFLRLHQILIQRLNTAKRLAFSVDDDCSLVTLIEQMPHDNRTAVGRRRYEAYLSLVYALLDGGVGGGGGSSAAANEGGKYEDRVRSLLGHGGYELATMDKLISHIWKNLQAMAGDETMWNLIQLYRRHLTAGSFQPEAFRQEAAYLSDGEPMYAFQHCCVAGKDESVLYMEYMGVIMEEEDEGDQDDENNHNNVMMVVEQDETTAEQPSSKRQRR